jgi:hypothetical protein
MDFNRTEMERELRTADREQRSSLAGFRSALSHVFTASAAGRSEGAATAGVVKAQLLGLPGRRQVLTLGGATLLGAAVFAACGSDSETTAGDTGDPTTSTTERAPVTTEPDPEEAARLDLVLLRTAASLENLAVAVYGVALGTSSVAELPVEISFDPAVANAAELFQSHHEAHADALNAALEDLGEQAYTEPNKYIFDNAVTPQISSLTNEEAVIRYARDLENIAAGTYAHAAGQLSSPELRQTIMSIGGVEARHAAALSMVLDVSGRNAVPLAFTDASPRGRVPEESLLTEAG